MALAIPMPELRDTGTWAHRRLATTHAEWTNRQDFLTMPIAGPRFVELRCDYVDSAASLRLDKGAALADLQRLRALPPNWSGYGDVAIDRRVIRAAEDFILSLPSDIITTPKVVPMTRGRLQFEWHRGNRSLELEFETSDRLHYLKWDSDADIEEEDVISVSDADSIHSLLRWFASEPVNV